jgi:hypothetical protein
MAMLAFLYKIGKAGIYTLIIKTDYFLTLTKNLTLILSFYIGIISYKAILLLKSCYHSNNFIKMNVNIKGGNILTITLMTLRVIKNYGIVN